MRIRARAEVPPRSEAETAVRDGGGWMTASFCAALVAGVLLRLFFLLRFAHIAGDSLVYGDLARNLLVHHVYGFSTTLNDAAIPRPTLIRLPGYPLFVAACFRVFGMDHFGAVLGLQALVDLGTCLLMAGTARRLWGMAAGMAALWMGALCPFTANYIAAPLTETLTLFCIAAAFYCLERWRQSAGGWCDRWVVALGAVLAYAILLRPEQGLLAAAVLPAMLWMKRARGERLAWAVRPVVVVALLAALPLVPWTLRNWRTFHVFEPLAPRFANDPGEANPAGFQRWYRTWAIDFASTEDVYWAYDGSPLEIGDLPDRAFDSNEQYARTAALLNEYNESEDASQAFDARFDALARERIRAHPMRYYAALPLERLANMVLRPRTELLPLPLAWWRVREHPAASLIAVGMGLLNLAFFGLAIATVSNTAIWRRHRVVVWCMLGTVLMRSALLLTLDNSEPRYTLEFFPVLIVLGSATLARWLPLFNKDQVRERVICRVRP